MNADTRPKARSAARRFADRWPGIYPKAAACLRNDLDELLTCFTYKTPEERTRLRTTNANARRFREVRRRHRPMGAFPDRTSMEDRQHVGAGKSGSVRGNPGRYRVNK